MSDVRDKTIALFERHRATPGRPVEAEHFLDFLLAAPKKDRAVYNSFSGLRRFNAFFSELQLEFAVCFSKQDRDANYSLDRLVARIEQLQRSPRSSLASLSHQSKGGPDVNVLIVFNILLLGAAAALRAHTWGILAFLTVAAAFNSWYANFYFEGKRYLVKLRQRIATVHGTRA